MCGTFDDVGLFSDHMRKLIGFCRKMPDQWNMKGRAQGSNLPRVGVMSTGIVVPYHVAMHGAARAMKQTKQR